MGKEYNNLEEIYDLKITNVKPNDDYTLLVTYDNGEVIEYDVKPIMKNKLSVLLDKKIFNNVFLDKLGNIAWNIDSNIDSEVNWDNRIDISKESIYLKGTKK